MAKCDSCTKNLKRYNGREVECKDFGRRGQRVNHCDNYNGMVIKFRDALSWTGVK